MRSLSALALAALVACPAVAEEKKGCYGTAIAFFDTPKEAAASAKKNEQLVLVLHVSGYFENPAMT
jgi:hypothetical protein